MSGRIALVTGGGRGIGRGIGERLAKDGMQVVLISRNKAEIEQAAGEIGAVGLVCDVADEAQVTALFVEIDRRFGRLDVLVNNAGISPRDPGGPPSIETATLANMNLTLGVNLIGPFLTCRAAVGLMKRNQWGRIVNISSRGARTRLAGTVYYSTSKAGLQAFSRQLAGEVGKWGITVNCIAPAAVSTQINRSLPNYQQIVESNIRDGALGRIGTPEDIAGAVAFLASDDSAFITGTILDVNGGTFMAN